MDTGILHAKGRGWRRGLWQESESPPQGLRQAPPLWLALDCAYARLAGIDDVRCNMERGGRPTFKVAY